MMKQVCLCVPPRELKWKMLQEANMSCNQGIVFVNLTHKSFGKRIEAPFLNFGDRHWRMKQPDSNPLATAVAGRKQQCPCTSIFTAQCLVNNH
jgi:hypothetical protein